ncbi:radical SAM family heme chaperone HemW [Soonwooa sp.]|uniref:radical SAM family heme chaperone HemW n=1 Tax=Soonwooa sp. TaxID=1938592 RepID=UPI00289FBB66|nr:radical SAM family heme chaperone HemW [Soonwooa sp.]
MIYIHIPFCKQKCTYCNFHFSTSLKLKEDMLSSIIKEFSLRYQELENKKLDSLYFGGGTPSILEAKEIGKIIDEANRYFEFNPDIELTLEANPDDLNASFLKEIINIGVNRLSIGTQSFFEDDLKLMNRAHTASEAESSIKRAQDFGLENISVDLIYGSPTSTMEQWKQNLAKIIELQVPHVSSYALTIEPKTILDNWITQQKVKSPDEAFQNDAFFYMSEFLKENGFDHYEISNFGKPNFHSKHNSSYWEYKEYLGIGPSAHSYDGKNLRSWNVANNTKYIKSLSENQLPIEREELNENDRYNEMLMIGLRTQKGVDLMRFKNSFSSDMISAFETSIQQKIKDGILKIENNRLIIPEQHWFMADGIASDLFLV